MSTRQRFNTAAATPDTAIGPHGETALHLAAQSGDALAAAKTIAEGATVFIMDRHNNSPLIYAAQKGDAATIRVIVQADRKGINYAGNLGTALGIVAQGSEIPAAKELLDGGADINAADDMGATPLMDAVFAGEKAMAEYLLERGANANILRMGEGTLHLAARKGNADMLRLLLKYDAAEHINQQTKTQRMTPLHIAVLTGEYDMARELIGAGALTNIENAQGFTPVMLAAEKGDAKMIRLLVEQGFADLRVTAGEERLTPLHRAAAEGKLEAVRELVRLGADPLAKDAEGRTAAELAAFKGQRETVEYFFNELPRTAMAAVATDVLYAAISAEHAETVASLLRLKVADLNAHTRDGHTVLGAAVDKYDIPLVKTLLERGAKTDTPDKVTGETPLFFSARRGRSFFAEQLIAHGADVDTRVGLTTALHIATEHKHLEMVKVLAAAGANPFLKDEKNRTPLMIAREEGRDEIAKILEQAEKDYVTRLPFPKSAQPSP